MTGSVRKRRNFPLSQERDQGHFRLPWGRNVKGATRPTGSGCGREARIPDGPNDRKCPDLSAKEEIFPFRKGNHPMTSHIDPHTYCTGKRTRYSTSSLMSYIVYRRFSHQFRMGRHHQRADRLIDARPSVSPVNNSHFRRATFSRARSFLSSFQIAQSTKAITRKLTTIAVPVIIVGSISVVANKHVRTHWTTGMRPRMAKAMKRSRTDRLLHIRSFKHANAPCA